MRRTFVCSLAIAAATMITLGFSAARAQYGGQYGTPSVYYNIGGTPDSYFAHGFADVVRSAGAYNLMTSEKMKNVEDARKKYIENRLQWTQTYFEMRRINDEYRRAQYKHDRRSPEELRYAQAAAPKRLTSSQLDPITGYLAWPRLLASNAFADLRRDLDKLFGERASTKGAIGNDNYFLILDRVDQMKERLRGMIKDVPTSDYIDASKFLESLGYEAGFAAGYLMASVEA